MRLVAEGGLRRLRFRLAVGPVIVEDRDHRRANHLKDVLGRGRRGRRGRRLGAGERQERHYKEGRADPRARSGRQIHAPEIAETLSDQKGWRVRPAWYICRVNAEPLLQRVARALQHAKLEAVLIGNAAAALHGAPVTTLDFDFMFRVTPASLRKLKAFARELHAIVLKPYYPVSDLFRVVSDDLGLQVDFLATIHGVRSFESLRARSVSVTLGEVTLAVATLEDIVKSKRAAGRPKDYAVLSILEATLDETARSHAQAVKEGPPGRSRTRK